MSDSRGRNEAETRRRLIDPALRSAGWTDEKVIRGFAITDGRIIDSGRTAYRGRPLEADYLLEYRPGRAIGVVEAKREGEPAATGVEQALRYARMLYLPFVYATNGHETLEIDKLTGTMTELAAFPSPEELGERHRTAEGIADGLATELALMPFSQELRNWDNSPKRPRYYQRLAVDAALQAIASGTQRILLTLATGTGNRGVLGYDTPIVELWPEFGAHGKQAATIRHALTHSVGVPGVPPDTTPEDLCDWDKMCQVIADAEPWWEPGTKVGYHAVTFGYIVGEIVRRATGKPISQVLREELAGPLGIASELYFGIPSSELGRLARLEDAENSAAMLAAMSDDAPIFKAAPVAVMPNAEFGNRPDVLMADIPAGGKMSARAVARMYAALLGEVDGVRLVSPERLLAISAVAISGVDQVMGFPSMWGLGYAIGRPGSNPQDTQTVFGMGGAGGTFAYADTATGISFALAKNRLTADFNTVSQVSEIVSAASADS